MMPLYLAEKLGLKKLIVTSKEDFFGYGGARNCQYLLTGVIRAAFDHGNKSVGQITQMQKEPLLLFFQESVLGGVVNNPFGDAIFMLDDDMLMPEANIFSAFLFASMNAGEHLGCSGLQYGRGSKYNLYFWGLDQFLQFPETTHMFPKWLDYLTGAGLSEQLTRPKVCLNLPQGNEEAHYLSLSKGHFLLQPSFHLCGSRYPNQEIPTHFFVGLAAYIDASISFVMPLFLIDYFIDPLSRNDASVLPWNVENLSSRFTSLRQGLMFISSKRQELEMRFWKNLREFFLEKHEKFGPILQVMQALMQLDVDATLKVFEQNQTLLASEKAALAGLSAIYKKHQEDARLFWLFGMALVASSDPSKMLDNTKNKIEKETDKKISQYSLSQSFYLMACAVGRGDFCQIVSEVVKIVPSA